MVSYFWETLFFLQCKEIFFVSKTGEPTRKRSIKRAFSFSYLTTQKPIDISAIFLLLIHIFFFVLLLVFVYLLIYINILINLQIYIYFLLIFLFIHLRINSHQHGKRGATKRKLH